jgi:hypothetical protein
VLPRGLLLAVIILVAPLPVFPVAHEASSLSARIGRIAGDGNKPHVSGGTGWGSRAAGSLYHKGHRPAAVRPSLTEARPDSAARCEEDDAEFMQVSACLSNFRLKM